jgi:hypothetical protein
MRNLTSVFASLCMMVLVFASPARGQSVLWVASNGSDANACSQTAPCATFQGAINKGAVAQINCVNSGSYGVVTITASITIDCGTGNVGNIVISSTSGIFINTSAPATIILRHLAINGLHYFLPGINAQSFFSGTLIVEDCMIHGFASAGGVGIFFSPTNGRGLLQVSNSQIFGNYDGIILNPASGQIASVTLSGVELTGNVVSGLTLGGAGVVAGTIRNSVLEANGQYGLLANAGQVFFTVEESSIIANLSAGLITNSAGSVVNVGNSTIGTNSIGVDAVKGSIISLGNNQMSANGSNGNFTSTIALQ